MLPWVRNRRQDPESNGVFGSVYFKGCHGLYVNALGERLEGNNDDVEDEIAKKVDDMELKARRGKATSEEFAETSWKQWIRRDRRALKSRGL
jgi:hypothetical protein